ncbi:helix-turn-helix domain-containing protein [Streptomyces sp. NBC_01433]|uniref:helix-turn-helix domain-containing protein n=1 Tax=Streptomyces sp. NBC_01433 TaxID=2903864 RepID=UPI002251EF92|nr:helix-turn-helix transcriptional regulator [Streptomyces sp. NBC_01433]MCX4674506.1 helix-turn-helix domain-containing protein [Streptomyces sp. NBC_01433]
MAQWDDYSTGTRIKLLRGKVTQQNLADLTGLSIGAIQKAEQDQRMSLRTLLKIADALGTDISVIHGQQAPHRMQSRDDRTALQRLSRAVHDTSAGFLPNDIEPPTLVELGDFTRRVWKLYWKGHYSEAAGIAAPFLAEAAARLREQPDGERAEAWEVLSDAYRIGAYCANLMGARDLAYSAIGHARGAAERAASPMRLALVDSGRSWIYLRDARLDDALVLAEKAALDIEPRFSRATADELTVYGSHINFAAVVASRAGNQVRAEDFLSQSHATGALMGGEHGCYGTLFGPVTATTQAVGINVALGETGKALKLAESIKDTSPLQHAARNRYAMDKALAQADAKMWDASLDTLERALVGAPEWARHQALPGVIVEKVGRASTARLRRISKLIGASPASGGFRTATRRTAL